MGSAATKPSCAPKEFWTGCQENFPRGSKLFQKFRDYMREKEHESGEHLQKLRGYRDLYYRETLILCLTCNVLLLFFALR